MIYIVTWIEHHEVRVDALSVQAAHRKALDEPPNCTLNMIQSYKIIEVSREETELAEEVN